MPMLRADHPMTDYVNKHVCGLPHWQIDALKVELAFMEHLHMERPEWTKEDTEDLEGWCHALMQGTRQMTAGQEGYAKKDECGEYISFDDLPQILNNISVMACRLVLSGELRKEK